MDDFFRCIFIRFFFLLVLVLLPLLLLSLLFAFGHFEYDFNSTIQLLRVLGPHFFLFASDALHINHFCLFPSLVFACRFQLHSFIVWDRRVLVLCVHVFFSSFISVCSAVVVFLGPFDCIHQRSTCHLNSELGSELSSIACQGIPNERTRMRQKTVELIGCLFV